MLTKASEIARKYGLSRHAVYDWIRRGLIPDAAITRVGGKILLDAEMLDGLIRSGRMFRRPRRYRPEAPIGEDSVTTVGRRDRTEHRWMGRPHPYGGAQAAALVERAVIELAAVAGGGAYD